MKRTLLNTQAFPRFPLPSILRISVLVLWLSAAIPGTARALPIRGEFWVRADLLDIATPGANIRETGELSERERNALKELLEDARWAFSGMVYGFSVKWTPPSVLRNVTEELEITPLALIPSGDPRMRTVSITREEGFIYIMMEYRPDEAQEGRLSGWQSEAFPLGAGVGLVPVNRGSRRQAMEAAVKDALHQWLRAREFNRPREIRGRAAFTEFPKTGLEGGSLKAIVSLRMDLEPLRIYSAD